MASPSAARMYGYNSPNEMIGTSAVSYYNNPEDRRYGSCMSSKNMVE